MTKDINGNQLRLNQTVEILKDTAFNGIPIPAGTHAIITNNDAENCALVRVPVGKKSQKMLFMGNELKAVVRQDSPGAVYPNTEGYTGGD